MKTTYLVWKDPTCAGINPDWQELSGREFYALVRSPESKGRHFIKLFGASEDGGDRNIVMEAAESVYKDWRKEKRHRQHLRDANPGYKEVSYHAMRTEDGCYGEELLADIDCDMEAECFKMFEQESVREAIARLNEDERRLIEYFYLSSEQGTERGCAELAGISKSTANRRKMAVLEKMKKFFAD